VSGHHTPNIDMQFKIAVPLLILLCAATTLGQTTQCTLKLSDLPATPELLGFKLGMTMDQVKARVPQVVFGQTNEFGVSKTTINPDFDPRIDKTTFAGARTVSLDFLDGRLTSLWLGYDASFKWTTVDEFVKGISDSLHLPAAWAPWRTHGQRLHCADFQMTLTTVAEGPSFRIIDEVAEQTVADRREAKEALDSAQQDESDQESVEILADKQAKVFYPEGCTPSKEIKESDRVTFKSTTEAEQAGYKPAKNCH
jgi:hypothetical protein